MLNRPRDKAGGRYEYFTCSGRRRKTTNCTRSAILAQRAEAEIERTYQGNSLTQTEVEHVRKVLNDVFDQLEGSSKDARKLLTAQRDKLDDLYTKCEPAEPRILNRALFTRITIDDEEDATCTPEQTTASVLAHTNIDAPTEVTAETKLPRHQAGQFRFSHLTWS